MNNDTSFEATHLLDGVLVRRVGEKGNIFEDEQGNQHRAVRGHKSVHLSQLNPQDVAALLKGEPETPPSTPPVPSEPVPGDTHTFSAEVACAILRAAVWPMWGESQGYAEAVGGHTATLDGTNPDGTLRVCVCVHGEGRYVVSVPRSLPFEITERVG